MPEINPCPRCKSKMNVIDGGGSTHSFPYVGLSCPNKDCIWQLRCYWDDLSEGDDKEEAARKKLIHQWNEGTKPA